MTGPRVEIAVDEVVLRGVPPEQADAVVAALTQRLEELAGAAGPMWPATADVSLPAARPRVPEAPVTGTVELGRLAAEAVWSTLRAQVGGDA